MGDTQDIVRAWAEAAVAQGGVLATDADDAEAHERDALWAGGRGAADGAARPEHSERVA